MLTRIYREFGGAVSLNAWAAIGGRIAVGDEVELLEHEVLAPPTVVGRFVNPAALPELANDHAARAPSIGKSRYLHQSGGASAYCTAVYVA